MWCRKPRGFARHWEEYARYQTLMMRLLADGFKRGGSTDREIGEVVAASVEDIDCASVYIDLVTKVGSFDDFAWIERRHQAAIARLDEETDAILLPGLRRIVTSWYEEKAYFKMKEKARALAESGDGAGAQALFDEFAAWMTARTGVPWTKPEDKKQHFEYQRWRIDPEEWRKASEQ